MLLVLIHLLSLLALACSNTPVSIAVFSTVVIGFSFYYSLYRYGLMLNSDSIEVLEFKQQCWRLKRRGASADEPARVVGRLAFGVAMLDVRGSGSFGSSFLLLTEAQLCPEQFRILKGLVISA